MDFDFCNSSSSSVCMCEILKQEEREKETRSPFEINCESCGCDLRAKDVYKVGLLLVCEDCMNKYCDDNGGKYGTHT